MPVSSLIFVVIVAIWAAYLVQHWARRREDAAASRSVEGFSEAMRVLEKRPALPATELGTPRPHSYAVKPASVARPTVDVKRAVPAGTSRRHSPLVARRVDLGDTDRGRIDPSHTDPSHTDPSHTDPSHTDHDIAPYAAEVDRMPESARPSSPHAPRRHGTAAAPARVPLAQRRLRAVLLLAAVAWLPTSVALSVTGVLMWVSVPFAVLTVVAVLVWLRAEARADRLRAAPASDSEGHRDEGTGRRRRRRHDYEAAHPPVLSTEDTQVIRSTVAAEAEVVAPAASAPRQPAEPGVFDVQAPVTGEVPVAAAEVQEVPEGSWSPVPVPLPTYTLKAKAEPRYTDSGIPADVFDTPEFADEADELDDRALFARRAVSQ
ncbi:hypothetical protein ACFQU3_13380 [Terrabacter sp. GCM10028922]|uniref:hypothetical protein n=1 Tax=Terrabacter sp. GCM10028922 TaxID=3273428 RepID=UPI00361AC47D